MKIKIDPADEVFSQAIRLRDGECVRCHSEVKLNEKGLPISHTTSHYFGRSCESVRFSQENCDCLCFGCHRIWETKDREAYREFKIKQLGENRYNALIIQARTTCKKDRKLALIKAKEFLKEQINND